MAINLSSIDFIIPVSIIEKKYIGGFEKCLYDHRRSLGGSVYLDKNLFHTGAMSPDGIEELIDKWSALGFEATDFCVVQSLLPTANNPCEWLTINYEERSAHMAGTVSGPIAGRRLFYERRKTEESRSEFKKDCRRMRWTALLIYRLKDSNPALASRLESWLVRQLVWKPLELSGQGSTNSMYRK